MNLVRTRICFKCAYKNVINSSLIDSLKRYQNVSNFLINSEIGFLSKKYSKRMMYHSLYIVCLAYGLVPVVTQNVTCAKK